MNEKRHAHVRTLLRQSRLATSDERAGTFAEQAADILLTFLNKPLLAQLVYQFAARKISDPSALEKIIEELKWTSGQRQRNLEATLKALTENRLERHVFEERVQTYLPQLVADGDFREEVLSVLRSRERFDHIVTLLERCAKHANATERRCILLALGHALRFGKGNLPAAAHAFEELVYLDPHDREAWGELLECLDDSGDNDGLLQALNRRIELTTGLEREQLERQAKLLNQTSHAIVDGFTDRHKSYSGSSEQQLAS